MTSSPVTTRQCLGPSKLESPRSSSPRKVVPRLVLVDLGHCGCTGVVVWAVPGGGLICVLAAVCKGDSRCSPVWVSAWRGLWGVAGEPCRHTSPRPLSSGLSSLCLCLGPGSGLGVSLQAVWGWGVPAPPWSLISHPTIPSPCPMSAPSQPSSLCSSGLSKTSDQAYIEFESIEAIVKTASRTKFFIEFYSTCLEGQRRAWTGLQQGDGRREGEAALSPVVPHSQSTRRALRTMHRAATTSTSSRCSGPRASCPR